MLVRDRALPIALLVFAAACLGCTQRSLVPPHPTESLHFPVSLAAAPDGNHVLVASSNFDQLYAGGAILVMDARTDTWVPGASVQVESFGGQLAVWPQPDGRAWLYLPEREDGGIRWLSYEPTPGAEPHLACSGEVDDRNGILVCDDSQVRTTWTNGALELHPGADPFGAVVRPGSHPLLVTSALSDGAVGFFELDGQTGIPALVDVRHVATGTLGLTLPHPADAVWVISTGSHSVWRMVLADASGSRAPAPVPRRREALAPVALDLDSPPPAVERPTPVVRIDRVALPTVASGAQFGQFGAVDPDGHSLYVTTRSPAGLAVVDFVPSDAGGAPKAVLRGWVPLGTHPTALALSPGPEGHPWAWVACFGDDTLYAVDVDAMRVEAVLPVGRGPFGVLALEVRSLHVWRVFVALFDEHAVAVIDADPASPTFASLIAKVH